MYIFHNSTSRCYVLMRPCLCHQGRTKALAANGLMGPFLQAQAYFGQTQGLPAMNTGWKSHQSTI